MFYHFVLKTAIDQKISSIMTVTRTLLGTKGSLACDGNFRCWPKADTSSAVGRSHERRSREKNFSAGHYKDLTETGNRARKVSGTQGRLHAFYGLQQLTWVLSLNPLRQTSEGRGNTKRIEERGRGTRKGKLLKHNKSQFTNPPPPAPSPDPPRSLSVRLLAYVYANQPKDQCNLENSFLLITIVLIDENIHGILTHLVTHPVQWNPLKRMKTISQLSYIKLNRSLLEFTFKGRKCFYDRSNWG